MFRAWTWARVPFGPTRRRQDAVDVPLSTGPPGPSQVVSPRRPASRRLLPAIDWTWHPLGGAGARSVDPGQPGNGVAPSYAERPCGGRREPSASCGGPVNTRVDLRRRGIAAGQRRDRRSWTRSEYRPKVLTQCLPNGIEGDVSADVRHYDGSVGKHHHNGRIDDVRGRRATGGGGAAAAPGLEADAPAAPADAVDRGGHLDDVARLHGGPKCDLVVSREQPFVTVGADAQLGRRVPEQAEDVGAVDQRAAVVGVCVRHVAAVRDACALGRRHRTAAAATRCGVRPEIAWTRYDATSRGVVPFAKIRSAPISCAAAGSKRGPPTTSTGRGRSDGQWAWSAWATSRT